jgi:hypothetical protein
MASVAEAIRDPQRIGRGGEEQAFGQPVGLFAKVIGGKTGISPVGTRVTVPFRL